MIKSGTQIVITYPRTTHVARASLDDARERPIRVHRIRDLVRQPLTLSEFLRRPFVLRSRWLVTATDERLNRFRQFYLGTSKEFLAPCDLRIGLYEPGGDRPVRLLSRGFAPTMDDRRLLVKTACRWAQRDLDGLQIGVYADDMRIFS